MNKVFENKESGFILKTEIKRPKAMIVYWVMFFILVMYAALSFVPLLWVILSGLKDTKEFYMVPPTIIPKSFHPEKVLEMWSKFKFTKYYLNSFVYSVGCVLCSLLFNGLAGYVLSRLRPKGHKVIFSFIAILMMVPANIGQVPLYMQLVELPYIGVSALGSYIPLWLMSGASAYYIVLFKSFFDSISDSYIEAARIDGCTTLGIFFKIVLPLSIPVFMIITIFVFNSSWGNFFWPSLVLTESDTYPVITFLYRINKQNYSIDEYLILLTLAMIPPAVLFAFFQKHIMKGFALGGVKG